jgi:hypothetical protein
MKNDLYNITEAEIDEFDQLYDGTIDEKDYYLLKARMELDEILKHKYTVYKLLRKEIEQDGLSSKVLKFRFVNLDNKIKRRKKSKRFWIGLTISIAAILITIINSVLTNPNEVIYERYRYSETGLPLLMGDSKQSKMDSAMVLIGAKQYDNAHETLKSISENDTVFYYRAFCLEQLGDVKNASILYQELVASKSNYIKQKSEFRNALLSTILNKQKPFEKMKLIASDSTHVYQKLAQEIIATSVK